MGRAVTLHRKGSLCPFVSINPLVSRQAKPAPNVGSFTPRCPSIKLEEPSLSQQGSNAASHQLPLYPGAGSCAGKAEYGRLPFLAAGFVICDSPRGFPLPLSRVFLTCDPLGRLPELRARSMTEHGWAEVTSFKINRSAPGMGEGAPIVIALASIIHASLASCSGELLLSQDASAMCQELVGTC